MLRSAHECQSKADTYAMAVQFCEFAKAACDSLAADNYWADYIDPCSGLPVCICICDCMFRPAASNLGFVKPDGRQG
jgi:Methylmalonic aciduria and homocystinuria type D protein